MSEQNLSAVDLGERITFAHGPDNETAAIAVGPACRERHAGHWHCVTHDESFPTQIAKDSHIHSGTHRLVWVCHYHGPEVP